MQVYGRDRTTKDTRTTETDVGVTTLSTPSREGRSLFCIYAPHTIGVGFQRPLERLCELSAVLGHRVLEKRVHVLEEHLWLLGVRCTRCAQISACVRYAHLFPVRNIPPFLSHSSSSPQPRFFFSRGHTSRVQTAVAHARTKVDPCPKQPERTKMANLQLLVQHVPLLLRRILCR